MTVWPELASFTRRLRGATVATLGVFPQQRHDLPVHAGVEAGRRLVEQQQERIGEEFQPDRDAPQLAARKRAEQLMVLFFKLQPLEHTGNGGVPYLPARRAAQAKAVTERRHDGQGLVQVDVLRHRSQ